MCRKSAWRRRQTTRSPASEKRHPRTKTNTEPMAKIPTYDRRHVGLWITPSIGLGAARCQTRCDVRGGEMGEVVSWERWSGG